MMWFSLMTTFILISDRGQTQILTQSVARFPVYATPSNGNHDGVGSSLLSFMQLVRQRTNGNQLQQCPCVNLPGSDKCITYDSRYMAVSIEEAILTFVDQSMDPRIYEQRTGGPITPASFACSSNECRQCVAMIAARLRQIGLLRRQLTFSFPIPSIDQINPNACPRIRLSRGINIVPPTQTVSWAAEAIRAAAALREQFSQRPKSIFARIVEQAISEAKGSGGGPPITRILQSERNHQASLPPTSNGRQNAQNGGAAGRNQNNGQATGGQIGRPNNNAGQNGGSTNIGTGVGNGNQQTGNQPGNIQIGGNNGVGGQNRGNTGINAGGNVAGRGNQPGRIQVNGNGQFGQNFQAGLGADGRLIGLSRPRNFPRPQIPRLPQQQPSQIPRFQPQFTLNPNRIGQFQQAIGVTPRPQQVIPQFQQTVAPQVQQFIPSQQQFQQTQQFVPQVQQFIPSQQQFQQAQQFVPQVQQFIPSQQQVQQNWNGQQWTPGQSQFWQPQTAANTLGQASQFIPDASGAAASNGGSFGGNNNNGIGLALGTNGGNWGGAGGASPPASSGEHGGGFALGGLGFAGRTRKTRQAQRENVVGWGTCSQRYRNVDILQKSGNDWIPTTISTATCCDCKVKAGSDAHSLVIGGKK